jgi:hypothetical protein
MILRTITLDADDLDRVAAFIARILPDEIDEADRAALERFADAIDAAKPIEGDPIIPWPPVLFPFPTVIGPDGAAHPARSRR